MKIKIPGYNVKNASKKVYQKRNHETTWRRLPENNLYCIRREVYDRFGQRFNERFSPERYPEAKVSATEYEEARNDEDDCLELVRKLNHIFYVDRMAREGWKTKKAFFRNLKTIKNGGNVLQLFVDYMFERTENLKYSLSTASMVDRYFCSYYEAKKLYDINEYHKVDRQKELAVHLLNLPNKTLSKKTLHKFKQSVNLFYRFLHEQSSGKIPAYKFNFSHFDSAKMKNHEATRLKTESEKTKPRKIYSGQNYVDEVTFKRIFNHALMLEREGKIWKISPCIWLAYHYGLRRQEALAITENCLRNDFLFVEQQLYGVLRNEDGIATPKYKHTKSKLKRKIPHWFVSDKDKAYEMIKEMDICHPSTLTENWLTLMDDMKLGYTFHNLRNSFCTEAFKNMEKLKINYSDIQLAMGHTDIRTTLKYMEDFRVFSLDVYRPTPKDKQA